MKAYSYIKTFTCVFCILMLVILMGCNRNDIHIGDLPPEYQANVTGNITVSYPMHIYTNLIPFLEGWGGKWFDDVNKKVLFVSDEKVLKGFSELVGVIDDGLVRPDGVSGNFMSKYAKLNVEDTVFRAGVFPGLYQAGLEYQSKGVNWNIANWPRFPVHRVGTGATGFGVYNRTKRPDTAAAFCLFLFTDEGQRAYHEQVGGSVPLTKNLAMEDFWRIPWPKDKINYDAFISYPEADTVGKFQCRLPDSVASIILSRINNVFEAHLSGRTDYKDSLGEIEKLATEKWETLFEGERT
jgi:ABC-type glycerol-3-phosphate transport system substrate-binding protein